MSDNVNNPLHYQFSNGAQVIDITENMNFNLGNVIKYVARAGRKTEDPLEDLLKAKFYLERELARLTPTETAWTLSALMEMRNKDWAGRPSWAFPRVWESLDDVPEGVIVEDIDGDLWMWDDDGDLKFQFSWAESWDDPEFHAVEWQLAKPFKEVVT